jgi:hypothetical protein
MSSFVDRCIHKVICNRCAEVASCLIRPEGGSNIISHPPGWVHLSGDYVHDLCPSCAVDYHDWLRVSRDAARTAGKDKRSREERDHDYEEEERL